MSSKRAFNIIVLLLILSTSVLWLSGNIENTFGDDGLHKILKERDVDKLIPLLSTNSREQLRTVIYSLKKDGSDRITNLLLQLWKEEHLDKYNVNINLIKKPLIKIEIAIALITRNFTDAQYSDYIKRHTRSSDPIVKVAAYEALRDIDDKESIDKLSAISISRDRYMMEVGISGIIHRVYYGKNKEYARQRWEKLKSDPRVDAALVKKYDSMYRK